MDQNVAFQQVHHHLRGGVPIGPSSDARPVAEPASSQGILPQKSQFLGLVTPSYLLCAALLAAMVAAAGIWELLANTRLLAALLAGGIVAHLDPTVGLSLDHDAPGAASRRGFTGRGFSGGLDFRRFFAG